MSAWNHQLLKPGVLLCDEYVLNNFTSLTTGQIAAQYTTARLNDMYERGIRKLSFRIPGSICTDLATYNTTYTAGNAAKISALGAVAAEWLALASDTAAIGVGIHIGGATYHTACVNNTSTARASAAAHLEDVLGDLGVAGHPRFCAAFGVEENVTGTPADYATKKKEFQEGLIDAIRAIYPNLTFLCSTLNYSNPSDLAGYIPPSRENIIVRSSFYEPFFLTHLQTETDYTVGRVDSVAPDYPFTEARRAAMETAANAAAGAGAWDAAASGRLATDADNAVGYNLPDMMADFNTIKEFELKWNIPVLVEEIGFAWRDAWGSNGSQIAWFNDVLTCAREHKMEDRIGFFSAGAISPGSVNFGLGATANVSTIVSVSKSALSSITGGRINVSSGEVSEMYNAERSDAIAWTPASLGTDLLAWYHGEDLTESDAAAVGTFTARVGWTNTASSSGASRPTCDAAIASMGNVKGLAFTDTQFLDIDGISRAVPFEVYLSCDPTIDIIGAGDQYTNIIDVKSAVTPRYALTAWRNSADTTRAYVITHAGTNVFGTGTAASPAWTDPQVLGLVIATGTGNSSVRLNGATMVTATATSNTITSLRIGAGSTGSTGLNGTVSDIVITKALTTDQRLRLEWWLSTRSGATLTGNKYSGSTPAGL